MKSIKEHVQEIVDQRMDGVTVEITTHQNETTLTLRNNDYSISAEVLASPEDLQGALTVLAHCLAELLDDHISQEKVKIDVTVKLD